MDNSSLNATYFQSETLYDLGEQKSAQTLFDNSIWLTTEEAAAYLRKTTHALRQMLYKGKLPARKFHGRLYFKKAEIHSVIDTSFF
jgi:excisionase family DNA binding protein